MLQLQPLHSLSSHLVDLLNEVLSLSFLSQIPKPEEDPCKSNVTSLQKSELHVLETLFGSRSGHPLNPQPVSIHRISLMARDSLGPSVAPCPVNPSTAHDKTQSWLEAPLYAPTTISDLYPYDGVLCSTFRSVHSINLTSSILKICYSFTNGRRLHFRAVVIALEWICHYQSRNLMDLVVWLLSDDNVSLKLFGSILRSNHSWPRLTHFKFLSNHNLSMCLYVVENGRRLHNYNVLTLIVRIDKYHLITMEEDLFSSIDRFILSKKPMLQPSSLIERTFTWHPISVLQNRLCTQTFFLETSCIKLNLFKFKDSFSTSLNLFWSVTNQQSPEIFVELSSTHHCFACGKLLSCSCLRCMDLPSNYRIYFIFVVTNHVVDVCLNFVLGFV